ncbi:MAG: tetratricopeptide repeat protein [Bryobacteraceae bacterium]|nr:tetratricopeptide repeat protein [Bryobacteraceae bacterium]
MMALAFSLLLAQNPDAFYERGVALFREGKLNEAIGPLEAAVRANPNKPAYLKALGVVHAAQSNYDLAEPFFRRACEIDLKEEDVCYYLGRALYALNRFEPAVPALEKALKVDRQPFRVYLGLAQAQEALGRNEEAEKNFKLAVEKNRSQRPEDDPRIHYGVFLFRQGRLEEAADVFQKAARALPQSSRARYEYGRVLYQTGKLEEAEKELKRAVEIQAGNGPAHLLLSKVYNRMGRAADAEKHARLGGQAVQ